MFVQLLEQLQSRRGSTTEDQPLDASPLCGPPNEKAFKVNFANEAAVDAGGPYREALDGLCAEVHSAALPLLVRTPNMTQETALDRGKWTLNPMATGQREMRLLELMGALIGIALRTKVRRSLSSDNIFECAQEAFSSF